MVYLHRFSYSVPRDYQCKILWDTEMYNELDHLEYCRKIYEGFSNSKKPPKKRENKATANIESFFYYRYNFHTMQFRLDSWRKHINSIILLTINSNKPSKNPISKLPPELIRLLSEFI